MKKYFIFATISFTVECLSSFAAKPQEIDFYDLIQRIANSIKDNALFSELNIPERKELNNLNTSSFKNTELPLLMAVTAAYKKINMSNRVIWLTILRDIRKYDRTEIEKSRPSRWYFGNLLDLTLGLEHSAINDAWLKGLREAYRDSLFGN